MQIQSETPDLFPAIREVLLAAFPTSTEADLVDRLRCDGDAAIALVALEGHEVLGHVMLSPMTAPMRALGLGPVAVRPGRHRQGIGHHLIAEALERARSERWQACFVLGDPAYYGRFGFSASAAEGFESPYAGPFFLALALEGDGLAKRSGRVDYAPAFQALA